MSNFACLEKGLIIVGDKRPARPAPRDVFIGSLEWAIDLERTTHRTSLPNHIGGLAAYDTWADALEIDADYPVDDAEVLFNRVMVHGDQCTMLYERRYAAGYLRQIAHSVPEAAGALTAAAALYEAASVSGNKLWPWGHDMGAEAQQGLAAAATRRELAGHIRAIKGKEAEAVEHLEQALAACKAQV